LGSLECHPENRDKKKKKSSLEAFLELGLNGYRERRKRKDKRRRVLGQLKKKKKGKKKANTHVSLYSPSERACACVVQQKIRTKKI
jgi:hypothetical protein